MPFLVLPWDAVGHLAAGCVHVPVLEEEPVGPSGLQGVGLRVWVSVMLTFTFCVEPAAQSINVRHGPSHAHQPVPLSHPGHPGCPDGIAGS